MLDMSFFNGKEGFLWQMKEVPGEAISASSGNDSKNSSDDSSGNDDDDNGNNTTNSGSRKSRNSNSSGSYNPEFTLRKCCSRVLYNLSCIFPHDTFSILRINLENDIQSTDDLIK